MKLASIAAALVVLSSAALRPAASQGHRRRQSVALGRAALYRAGEGLLPRGRRRRATRHERHVERHGGDARAPTGSTSSAGRSRRASSIRSPRTCRSALMFSRAVSPFAHHLMIRPDLKDTLKSPADLEGPHDRDRRARRDPDLRAGQGAGGGRAHAQRRRDQIHPVRPAADRADEQGGRCGADDLAVAGFGRGQGHRHQVDQCRRLHQGAAGGDLGLDDEHRLGQGQRGRGAQIRARHAARRARLLQRLSSRAEPRRGHADPGEIFEREGCRADRSHRLGRRRSAGPHRRGERDGRAGRRFSRRSSRATRSRSRASRRQDGLPTLPRASGRSRRARRRTSNAQGAAG